jgi:hypothetical protein
MKIQITDEAHNRVDWIVRTPLVRILLGVLVGWASFAALVVTSPSPLRWPLVGSVSAVVVIVVLILAFTTPVRERGYLERTIDGGDVQRVKRWLLAGKRVAWETPLDTISGFQMELRNFEESPEHIYTLARLWVVLTDDSLALLTDWAEPQVVQALGTSLARAGRRVFEE